MQKRLYKDRANKALCGVCSGFAKYFNLDPTVVRLVMVLLGLSGSGILFYIICAIIMPDEPDYIE